MRLAVLVLLAGSIFPFLCATAPASEMPARMEMRAHSHTSGMALLVDPVSDHGCTEFTPVRISREGAPSFVAHVSAWRTPMPAAEPRSHAPGLTPNRDVTIRAMFQVYLL